MIASNEREPTIDEAPMRLQALSAMGRSTSWALLDPGGTHQTPQELRQLTIGWRDHAWESCLDRDSGTRTKRPEFGLRAASLFAIPTRTRRASRSWLRHTGSARIPRGQTSPATESGPGPFFFFKLPRSRGAGRSVISRRRDADRWHRPTAIFTSFDQSCAWSLAMQRLRRSLGGRWQACKSLPAMAERFWAQTRRRRIRGLAKEELLTIEGI